MVATISAQTGGCRKRGLYASDLRTCEPRDGIRNRTFVRWRVVRRLNAVRPLPLNPSDLLTSAPPVRPVRLFRPVSSSTESPQLGPTRSDRRFGRVRQPGFEDTDRAVSVSALSDGGGSRQLRNLPCSRGSPHSFAEPYGQPPHRLRHPTEADAAGVAVAVGAVVYGSSWPASVSASHRSYRCGDHARSMTSRW
jgi:hypothetical protein